MKIVRAISPLFVLVLLGVAVPDAAAQPALSISDSSAHEPGAGTSPMRFDVRLSAVSGSTVTVDWSTSDGTATAPDDYIAGSGTLTFAPGVITQTITVLVNTDALTEATETLQVSLASPVNATLADATGVGTIGDPAIYRVKDLYSGVMSGLQYGAQMADIGGTLFFTGTDGTGGVQLWKSDGTEAGTTRLVEAAATNLVNVAGTAYFLVSGVSGYTELWKSDGAIPGTVLVRSFTTDSLVEPDNLVALGSTLLFTVDKTLWKSDGTEEGTVAISPQFYVIGPLTAVGSHVFFSVYDWAAGDYQLWKSDGTALGTSMVRDEAGESSWHPSSITGVNGIAFFIAGTYDAGEELWRSDGTEAGTWMVKDINPGPSWSFAEELTAAEGTLFFACNDGTHGVELCKSDGTAAGTGLVRDAVSGSDGSSPENLTAVGPTVLYKATTPSAGTELWKSDGTAAGTVQVEDIYPGTPGSLSSYAAPWTSDQSRLYFVANDGPAAHYWELWTSDGTPEGTYLVQGLDITQGDHKPAPLVISGSRLFFGAAPYPALPGTTSAGRELHALPLVPGVSVDDVSVAEGDSAATSMSFTVSLTDPATTTVIVEYATADGTATAGSDYTATSGTLTFAPGERVRTVTVDILGDTTEEATETLALVLSHPINASLRDGRGIGAIVDQDGPPVMWVNNAAVTEANVTVPMTFSVQLSKPSGSVVTVAYATADGTATAGVDYSATSGTLTFPPGETIGTVVVDVLGDTSDEPGEAFTLNLSSPVNAVLGDDDGLGIILDDDPPPALTISDASVNEPGAGTAPARFEVQLSAPSASTVTVAWTTVDGTAMAPADYVAGSGVLTFEPGVVAQTITVPVNADAVAEIVEGFQIVLSSPVNATVAHGTGFGTVTDPPAYLVADLDPEGDGLGFSGTADDGYRLDRLADVDGTLFFCGNPYANNGHDGIGGLYKTDGTSAGTVLLASINCREVVNVAGTAFAATGVPYPPEPGELWKSDGTVAGTTLVGSYWGPTNLTAAGDLLFFSAEGRLWRSDGTAAGTVPVGPEFDALGEFVAAGSTVFFRGLLHADPYEGTFWKSDGTEAGTASVVPRSMYFQPWRLRTMQETLYFFGWSAPEYWDHLWRSDGTAAGTYSFGSAEISWIEQKGIDGTLFLRARTYQDGENWELWKTNGGAPTLVADVNPGAAGSNPYGATGAGSQVFFMADDGTHGRELWKTDGTGGGTALVMDVNPGPARSDSWEDAAWPWQAVNGNGVLYFAADDGVHGFEPWASDGTPEGTYLVQDVEPSGNAFPAGFVVSGSHLFFVASGPYGRELYALPLGLGLSIDDAQVTEGDGGDNRIVQFTVKLSGPSTDTVTVDYATANETATAGIDYTAASGTLTFLAGERTKTVSVEVLGDAVTELTETFALVLSNPTNARLRDGRGIGTIVDQDAMTISVADATVIEANATVAMTFTLSLSAASGNAISVAYATADGTAVAGSDYTAKSGTVSFAPGVTTATVTVNVLGDTRDELTETFTLNLSSPVNAVIGDGQAVGTIEDDDATPTLNVGNATTTEGNSGSVNATFTVTLSAASGQEVTAQYTTVDGTATAGLDYTAASGTLTFPAGTTSRTFTVPILGETLDEGTETYTVVLSNVVNAVAGTTGTGTITDNDTTTITIANATAVAEGDTGSVDATFNVTLSVPNAEPVTVSYATADVTAVAGSDYTAASGTLTIPSGTTTLPVVVSVLGDVLDEANETFVVNLSDSSGPVISDAQGSVTITDDDASPTLSIDDVTVLEGNEGTVDAVFTVTLSAASGRTVTVNRATQNSTAMAPGDYTALSSSALTFPEGTTTQQVTVQVNGDLLDEPNEAFYVNLSSAANATIADTRGVGTITDDDIPAVSIGNVTVTEGNSGTKAASFAVTLSSAGTGEITVSYATADGTAVAPDDYTAATGTVTFAAGTTTQTVTILVVGETLDESTETFTVTLSSPVGATLGTATGTGTITDNDTTTIGISNVTVTEGDDAAVDATFNVTLSAPNPQAVSVSWATADATAVAGIDYTAANGTVTFPAGTTTVPVTVSILGDVLDEANETFVVNLSDSSGPTISDAQGVVTITDNDASPTLSIDDVTVLEGNEGTVDAVFTVTLSTVSGRIVTVNRVTANVTAVAPGDYTALSTAALTFPIGTTTQTVTVQVNGDTILEDAETFRVNLSGASNATLADAQGVGTITDDDETPAVSIGDVTVTEGNSGTKAANFTVTLSSAGTSEITVSYATADGTAVSPDDYTTATGIVTFPVGTTTQTVTVQLVGDLLDEANETFTVTLSAPVGATLGTATGTGTITDNDTMSIRIGNVTVTEGDGAAVEATFDVTLTAWNLEEVSVSWATADVTAVAGVDYTSGSGTLTFPVGTMSLPVTVSVLGDVLDEANETFAVNLSDSSGPTIADATGVGTITDDDASPTLSIDDVTVLEGNEGTVGAVFTVSLSVVSGRTVTVNRATLDGTAVAPADYVALSSAALSFPAGTTTQQVTVQVNGDVVGEEAETFSVNLSGATYATIADAQGLGTITDDDAPVPSRLRIDDASVIEGPDGTKTITFTVTREE